MSSQNKKPTTSSRQARPRALTTLTPHLSDTRGLTSDRIARVRSNSTQASRLSERQQLAILDAVVSSGAFHIPQYGSAGAVKSAPVHSSVDPNSLNLAPTEVILPTTRSPVPSLPSIPADSGTASFVGSAQLGDEALDLTSVGRQNMSVATYMLPSYGHMDPYNHHYQTGYQPSPSYVSEESQNVSRSSPPVTTTYAPAYTTSPSLMKDSPRLPQQPLDTRPHRSSFASSYHSAHASPYLGSASPSQPPYGFPSPAARTSHFTPHTPSSHGGDPTSASYTSAYSIPHPSYGASSYDSAFQNISTTSAGYVPTHSATYLGASGYVVPSSAELVSASGSDDGSGVRIINSRPKPQCWDHGCNGRQFSTFSNLLRHQREKSGTAAKSACPRCGAEFTRTTARNGHMAHDKCKRKSSNSSVGAE